MGRKRRGKVHFWWAEYGRELGALKRTKFKGTKNKGYGEVSVRQLNPKWSVHTDLKINLVPNKGQSMGSASVFICSLNIYSFDPLFCKSYYAETFTKLSHQAFEVPELFFLHSP